MMAQDYGYAFGQGRNPLGGGRPLAPVNPLGGGGLRPLAGPPVAPPGAGGPPGAVNPRDSITQALMQIQNPPPTAPGRATLPGGVPMPLPASPNTPTAQRPPMQGMPGMQPGMPGMPGMPPPPGMSGMPGLGGLPGGLPAQAVNAAAPGNLVQDQFAPTRPNPYA